MDYFNTSSLKYVMRHDLLYDYLPKKNKNGTNQIMGSGASLAKSVLFSPKTMIMLLKTNSIKTA